jgi:hypothetical protein
MHTIGTIREFHTRNFTVIVDAVEEDSPDLSFDDTGEVAAKIDSGEYVLFCARARVVHKTLGELASDYLGNCIYESLEAFMDHKECGKQNKEFAAAGTAGRCGSYFSDMVANVCSEARDAIKGAQSIKVRA